MDSFKIYSLYEDAVADAKKKLKKMRGKEVSFTHQASGEKVTGIYQGMKLSLIHISEPTRPY